MKVNRYWVKFGEKPCQLQSFGVLFREDTDLDEVTKGFGVPDGRVEVITEAQYDQLGEADEPSKVLADWFGLEYQKYIRQPEPCNIVELIADEDGGFDQPCRFGNRVESHAVYCHNSGWVDAPRKCRRTWYTGGEVKDEDCPGYEPNPLRLGQLLTGRSKVG